MAWHSSSKVDWLNIYPGVPFLLAGVQWENQSSLLCWPCNPSTWNNRPVGITKVHITEYHVAMTVPCKMDLVHRVPWMGIKENFLKRKKVSKLSPVLLFLVSLSLLFLFLLDTLSCTCIVYKGELSFSPLYFLSQLPIIHNHLILSWAIVSLRRYCTQSIF